MNVKDPATYEEQMKKLCSDGCIIDDDKYCLSTLQNVGYYRLLGYTIMFRDKNKNFYPGITVSKIAFTYEFDSNIRAIFFSCIEEIEVYTLTQCLTTN